MGKNGVNPFYSDRKEVAIVKYTLTNKAIAMLLAVFMLLGNAADFLTLPEPQNENLEHYEQELYSECAYDEVCDYDCEHYDDYEYGDNYYEEDNEDDLCEFCECGDEHDYDDEDENEFCEDGGEENEYDDSNYVENEPCCDTAPDCDCVYGEYDDDSYYEYGYEDCEINEYCDCEDCECEDCECGFITAFAPLSLGYIITITVITEGGSGGGEFVLENDDELWGDPSGWANEPVSGGPRTITAINLTDSRVSSWVITGTNTDIEITDSNSATFDLTEDVNITVTLVLARWEVHFGSYIRATIDGTVIDYSGHEVTPSRVYFEFTGAHTGFIRWDATNLVTNQPVEGIPGATMDRTIYIDVNFHVNVTVEPLEDITVNFGVATEPSTGNISAVSHHEAFGDASQPLAPGGGALEGSTVVFTATPTDGFYVVKWVVRDDTGDTTHYTQDTTFTINNLSEEANVQVHFDRPIELDPSSLTINQTDSQFEPFSDVGGFAEGPITLVWPSGWPVNGVTYTIDQVNARIFVTGNRANVDNVINGNFPITVNRGGFSRELPLSVHLTPLPRISLIDLDPIATTFNFDRVPPGTADNTQNAVFNITGTFLDQIDSAGNSLADSIQGHFSFTLPSIPGDEWISVGEFTVSNVTSDSATLTVPIIVRQNTLPTQRSHTVRVDTPLAASPFSPGSLPVTQFGMLNLTPATLQITDTNHTLRAVVGGSTPESLILRAPTIPDGATGVAISAASYNSVTWTGGSGGSITAEIGTFGGDTVITVTGIRPAQGDAFSVNGLTLEVRRDDDATAILTLNVNLTPLYVSLNPTELTINNATTGGSVAVGGSATGDIAWNIESNNLVGGTIGNQVIVALVGETISVTGTRPAAGGTPITGNFTVRVTRQNVYAEFPVTVNLTPPPQITGISGADIVVPASGGDASVVFTVNGTFLTAEALNAAIVGALSNVSWIPQATVGTPVVSNLTENSVTATVTVPLVVDSNTHAEATSREGTIKLTAESVIGVIYTSPDPIYGSLTLRQSGPIDLVPNPVDVETPANNPVTFTIPVAVTGSAVGDIYLNTHGNLPWAVSAIGEVTNLPEPTNGRITISVDRNLLAEAVNDATHRTITVSRGSVDASLNVYLRNLRPPAPQVSNISIADNPPNPTNLTAATPVTPAVGSAASGAVTLYQDGTALTPEVDGSFDLGNGITAEIVGNEISVTATRPGPGQPPLNRVINLQTRLAGSDLAQFSVTVNLYPPPEIIIEEQGQPRALTVIPVGDTAPRSLEVVAFTNPAGHGLTYQWWFNDTDSVAGAQMVSGATSAALQIPHITIPPGDSRYYFVVINTEPSIVPPAEQKTSAFARVRVLPSHPTPNIQIDFQNAFLTGFAPGETYRIDGVDVTFGAGETTLGITPEMLGETIDIIRLASGDFADSAAQSRPIPARPPPPTNVSATVTNTAITLNGVNDTMEFRNSAASSWTQVSGSSLGLTNATTYQLRVRAIAGVGFSSEALPIVISLGVTPAGTHDFPAGVPGPPTVSEHTVNVTNTGDIPVSVVVSLSDTDAGSFGLALSGAASTAVQSITLPSAGTLAPDETQNFTIIPVGSFSSPGLNTANVTVGNPSLAGSSFTVTYLVAHPVITITGHPSGFSTPHANISGELSVTASVTPVISLDYQWYHNNVNSAVGGTPIAGATGSTLNIESLSGGSITLSPGYHFFYVVVSGYGADSRTSGVARVTVTTPPTITGPTYAERDFGYAALEIDGFTITGFPVPGVTENTTHGGRIRWDSGRLIIEAGLPAGEHVVVLTAGNGVLPNDTLTFRFTVEGVNPVVSWPTNLSAPFGQRLSYINPDEGNGFATFEGVPVSGRFEWVTPDDFVGPAIGDHGHMLRFIPDDPSFNPVSYMVTIEVTRAAQPAPAIRYNNAPVTTLTRTTDDTSVTLSAEGGAGDGELEWSSSNPAVATVDQSGVVTVYTTTGFTDITVRRLGGTNHNNSPWSAHMRLTVVLPQLSGMPVFSGSNRIGQTLNVYTSALTGQGVGGAFDFEWRVGGEVISGVTGDQFIISGAHAGRAISVVITRPYSATGYVIGNFDNGLTVPFDVQLGTLSGTESCNNYTDNVTIPGDAHGRVGDQITLDFVLSYGDSLPPLPHGVINFVPYSIDSVFRGPGDDRGSGTRTYIISAADSVDGIITINATFIHADLQPRTLDFPSPTESRVFNSGTFIVFPNATPPYIGGSDIVVFTSSDTTVAEVHPTTGLVTIIGAGETTISATIQATSTHLAATASYALTITQANRPAPTGITHTNETSLGGNDGTISGVTDIMQWIKDGGTTWTNGNGATIEGLAPGVYLVRYTETTNFFASSPFTIEILPAPTVTSIEPTAETVSEFANIPFGDIPEGGKTMIAEFVVQGIRLNLDLIMNGVSIGGQFTPAVLPSIRSVMIAADGLSAILAVDIIVFPNNQIGDNYLEDTVTIIFLPNLSVTGTLLVRRLSAPFFQVFITNNPAANSMPGGQTEQGVHQQGQPVELNAGTRDGYTFVYWSSEELELPDADNEHITFTMPGNPMTITANWLSDTASTPTPPIITAPPSPPTPSDTIPPAPPPPASPCGASVTADDDVEDDDTYITEPGSELGNGAGPGDDSDSGQNTGADPEDESTPGEDSVAEQRPGFGAWLSGNIWWLSIILGLLIILASRWFIVGRKRRKLAGVEENVIDITDT